MHENNQFTHQTPDYDVQVIGENENNIWSPVWFNKYSTAQAAPQSDAH